MAVWRDRLLAETGTTPRLCCGIGPTDSPQSSGRFPLVTQVSVRAGAAGTKVFTGTLVCVSEAGLGLHG